MGQYSGLRFKGVVKKEYRKQVTETIEKEDWRYLDSNDENKDMDVYEPQYLDLIESYYSHDMFYDILCDISHKWTNENGETKKAFNRSYDEETGYWVFECCIKDYDDSIDKLLAYMPAFMERLDFIEVIDEPDFETRKLPDEIIALMNQDALTEY